jgi:HEPN domain-containing protein
MRKESNEWVKIAREDFQSAECLFDKSLYRMVCYHAQQTVEKILKAILTEYEAEFARTHNILDLGNAVEKIGHKTPLIDEDAIFLNSIYRTRYPSDIGLLPSGEPTKEDAGKALNIAREIVNWFKAIEARH